MYVNIVKRCGDFTIALLFLLIFSPIILLTFIILLVANRGNALFLQVRPGYNNKLFIIYKFKTMNDGIDSSGNILPDEYRITSIGKFIRTLSIDELLQLFNVLKGDMSLVGPRPLLTKYLTLYNSNQIRRHEVKPGITGWAQVNGRNTITWDEKFKFDIEYVENISFLLDMKIIFMTIVNILKQKGISAEGHATMEEFKGN